MSASSYRKAPRSTNALCTLHLFHLIPKPPVPIIFVFNTFEHNKTIKRDINQQDLKIVDLHIAKSKYIFTHLKL